MEKIKVLFITNNPSPYRIKFLSLLNKYSDVFVIYEKKIGFQRDKSWKVNEKLNYQYLFLRNSFLSIFTIIQVLSRKKDFFVIVDGYSSFQRLFCFFWLKLVKIKFAAVSDGFILKKEFIFLRILRTLILNLPSYWLVSSKLSVDYLNRHNFPKNSIFTFHFSSILRKDISQPKTSLQFFKGNKIKILSIGQIIKRKGFDILLKAIKEVHHKNVYLDIYGGKVSKELSNFIIKNKLRNIRFIDFLPHSELLNVINQYDFFVLPTRYDIWGLVINEVMAKGLPIITSDYCGAALEMLNGNGVIFKSESYMDLAIKINYFIENPSKLVNFSEKSIQISYEYTIERMVKDYLNFLKKSYE